MTERQLPARGARATFRDWDGSRITGRVEQLYTQDRRVVVAVRVAGDATGSQLRHLPLSHWVRR